MKKAIFIAEGILQSCIGLSAAPSGLLLIIRPDGSLMEMPVSVLKGSPFSNYLIPGILLFLVMGLGNLAAGIMSFRRRELAGFAGIFFGFALVIWIFIQVSMIGGGHWLQYLYFFLGIAEILLGFAIREG